MLIGVLFHFVSIFIIHRFDCRINLFFARKESTLFWGRISSIIVPENVTEQDDVSLKWMAPQDYSAFSCIADRCTHSCCAGWEIDIDQESLQRYRSLKGEWKERMEACIEEAEDGTACFRLAEKERCPFLQSDGLCELILHFGEDMLCQICTDHPRFRNFYADRTEIGLGLCCEEAARQTLARKEPMRLVAIEDDGMECETDPEEQAFLQWRNSRLSLAQNRKIPIRQRIHELYPNTFVLQEWKDFLLSLERMDESWASRIQEAQPASLDEQWDIPLEQLISYLLYRHLPRALENGDPEGQLAFAVFAWQMAEQLFASSQGGMDDLVEITRLLSSELEYSDENMDAIIEEIARRKDGKEE